MKQLKVFVDFREWLTFRAKRLALISLVVLGIFSAGLFFLPLTFRLAYIVVFIALTTVPIMSTVRMVTGSVVAMIQFALYNRKHKPRVEVYPEVKEIVQKMELKHSGEIYFTDNPSVYSPFVNLWTKRITVPESWLKKFHRTEIIAAIKRMQELKRKK